MLTELHTGLLRPSRLASATFTMLWVLTSQVATAQAPPPLGGEFQVNSFTPGNQDLPSVAVADEGSFVVVWQTLGIGGDDVVGQRYDTSGLPLDGEFLVNTYTTNHQYVASVATAADWGFVVVWQSFGSSGTDTDQFSIHGQRFDTTGMAVGDEFQVNSYTTGRQTNASVGVSAGGDFVVVWESHGSNGTDIDSYSIQGQRFDATGMAVGEEFQVNTYTTDWQIRPSVSAADNGAFVVVWDSYGSVGDDDRGQSIQGQRYDATGGTVGGQFQVNTHTYFTQDFPSISSSPDGDFVVAWTNDTGFYSGKEDIRARRFDSNGVALGDDFQVNTYTTEFQLRSSVAVAASGHFVVVWDSQGSSGPDTSLESIQGQRYDATGAAVGAEFQINTYTTGLQIRASVAVAGNGDFVVAWDSEGSSGNDDSSRSVQGQRFANPLFSDGLEYGHPYAWSDAIGVLPCAHDLCETGEALSLSCDPCVVQICAFDSLCCTRDWDSICVGYVTSICGQTCP